MKLCKNRNHVASYLGLHKCVASDQHELTVLLCFRVFQDQLKDYFLQPLPSLRNEEYQEFVPITRKQASLRAS